MAENPKPPGQYTRDGYLIRPVPLPQPRDLVPRERDVPPTEEPPIQQEYGEPKPAVPDKASPYDDLVKKLHDGEPWGVIRPEWLDPPLTAKIVDARNEGTVLAAGALNVELLRFQVPDRYVGNFIDFGHALSNPALFGTVTWVINVNEAPEEFYNGFTRQIGEYIRPTRFPSPIKVKFNNVITVTASNPGVLAVTAFARIRGWIFSVKEEVIWKFDSI